MAIQNPSTVNPETILSANKISKVLITNKNKPRVTTVIGNVNTTKTGLRKANKIPKIRATTIATV